MKVENAKSKWCPMTAGAFSTTCVASDCMSWRWFNQDSGYCGLAGKPENSAGSGIARPADISAAEVQIVDRFIDECCVICSTESPASVILDAFFQKHGNCMSRKRFAQIITSSCEAIKRGGKIFYSGIRLK